jgi:hypothetical protein
MSRLDRTNCEEAFRRLNDFLDHRLTPEELRIIEEHLEVFESSLLHGVKRKLRQLEAPPDLVARILSRLPPNPEAGS